MRILDILPRESIIVDIQGATKREVLEELSDAVVKHKPHIDRGRLMEVLLERERLGSTGIGDGIAIPHGKLKELDQLALSFGRSPQGVDFESMDGRPTHIFFLLITPENATGLHLKLLARISRILKNEPFKQKLMNANRKEDIYQIIKQEDDSF